MAGSATAERRVSPAAPGARVNGLFGALVLGAFLGRKPAHARAGPLGPLRGPRALPRLVRGRTLRITLACGFGHVTVSALLGVLGCSSGSP